MKRLLRAVVVLVVLVAVAAGAAVGWFNWRARAGMPSLEGRVTHASLKGEVTVKRDEWGVPHIYAEHEADAYFALGFSQAQDRLFQMEMMRRLAQGELAELLGPYVAPRIDAIARSFRLLPKAREHQQVYQDAHPEIQALAVAYCAGVNHFVETETLPVEFALLGIPKRVYTPEDCMSVAAILPITFADGLREDGLQSAMKARFPEMDTYPFFPGDLREPNPVTVMETIKEATDLLRGKRPTPPDAKAPQGAVEALPTETPMDTGAPTEDKLSALSSAFAPIAEYLGWGMGSNSWVVSGSHSASGKPLLANDPHIGFFNPSIWYEANITCPDFQMYGYYLPLIPMTLIGHNEHHGWALTMLANDDVDLYQETFNPENPAQVMYKGEWVDAMVEEQTIKVRFGADVTAQVRVTKHGPIITDLLRLMTQYDGPDVAMSWVWQHLEYTDLLAFHKMARAKSMEEFREGVALITSPGLNISYADAEGNIAWWAAGRLPVRPAHVNPKTLLDGASGNDEILSYLGFEDNPHRINPEDGFIVTANNWSTVKPLGPNGEIPYMQGYFQPLDRAGRIEQMLAERPTWTLEDMQRMQFDDVLYSGSDMRGALLAALHQHQGDFTAQEQKAYDVLMQWDLRHGVESVGAALFWATYEFTFVHWAGDEVGLDNLAIYDSLADSFNAYKHAMRNPHLPGWDNVNTPDKVETQDEILMLAFRDAVSTLAREYGADVLQWQWGKVHTMTFKHPLGYAPVLGGIFNIGPFPASGAQHVVNNMIYGGKDTQYGVIAGPSTRRVIDFSAPQESYSILPTGNSGHFLSENYDDQAPLFMKGEYRKLNFTPEQVDANTKHTMTLGPG